RVPGPAASRDPERLAAVDERRPALRHAGRLAVVDPGEVALLERVLARDVADEEVEPPVAVQVAEVGAHAFEGVVAEHLRARRRQPAGAGDDAEPDVAGRGAVV